MFTDLQVGSYLFMDREYVEIETGEALKAGFEARFWSKRPS